ncbi:hypothetical protein KP79_PYT22366 [Mizuhopecten yessoensis]|uniref:Uncharacterized protein n=1 Tax=Mizuhopecten yessoensis TaxID=6573 RepID=A0A210PWT0_MIZYE|nr:hypothetical protein KP79_PYT22366 [Mizuhopecten yessoensis]
MFHSRMYQNVTKTNSYTVKYAIDMNNSQFGQIQVFLKVDELLTGNIKYLAMLKVIHAKDSTTKLPSHFHEVNVLDETRIVDIEQLLEMCYYTHLSDKYFLGKLPVLYENYFKKTNLSASAAHWTMLPAVGHPENL